MTQPIHLRSDFWVLSVDNEAINVRVNKPLNKYWHVEWDYSEGHKYTSSGYAIFYKYWGGKKNYPQKLQIICTSKGATEEKAAQIVDGRKNAYRDYEREFNGLPLSVFTAEESLQSLLRSKGCDTDKGTFLIIQKL